MNKPKTIKSGAAMSLESEEPTIAGRLEVIQTLLGGEDICSECGSVTIRPQLITPEEALELLNGEVVK